MKKKRVLIIVENLPFPFARIGKEAESLIKAGYEVSVICPRGKGYMKKYEVIDGIKVYRHSLPVEAKSFKGYLIEYPWVLMCELLYSFKVLMRDGFDAIHACNPPDFIFIVAAVHKLLFRKKFIFDHHDINPEMYTAMGGKSSFLPKALMLFEKLSFRVADVSIATNQSYKKLAVTRGGMKEEDVFIVRANPVLEGSPAESDTAADTTDVPEELVRPGIDTRVGYIGVMGWQDNVDMLIRAADIVVNKQGRKNVQFVVIGDGSAFESLKAQTRELGIEENVVFTGWVKDKTRIARLLSACHIGAVPDEPTPYNTQSTMIKTMEYMALGKPLVQFQNIEGKFSARDASLYAEPRNDEDFALKLISLIDDPEKREQMSKSGMARIREELNWSQSEKSLLACYDRLFSK